MRRERPVITGRRGHAPGRWVRRHLLAAGIRLGMRLVRGPVFKIACGEFPKMEHQEVFGVTLFGRLREIEAAGDHGRVVDNHDFGMSDGVRCVNVGGDAAMRREVGGAVFGGAVALVQYQRHVDATAFGVEQSLGDAGMGERIRLNANS